MDSSCTYNCLSVIMAALGKVNHCPATELQWGLPQHRSHIYAMHSPHGKSGISSKTRPTCVNIYDNAISVRCMEASCTVSNPCDSVFTIWSWDQSYPFRALALTWLAVVALLPGTHWRRMKCVELSVCVYIQCLAKVFGPLELCDLLPHFRLQT